MELSFALLALQRVRPRRPATRCSRSRTLTWATPASPSSTGPAAWPVPGRWRSLQGESSCRTAESRTGSMKGISERVLADLDQARELSPRPVLLLSPFLTQVQQRETRPAMHCRPPPRKLSAVESFKFNMESNMSRVILLKELFN